MPIELISGLPGNGKTLRCLQRVRKLQKESGRAVYYYDIRLKGPELADWIPLGDPNTFGRRKEGIEPDKSQVIRWHEIVPTGSIMVIDECWAVFEKRGPSARVPKHVEEVATHRHRGIDMFFMSQHAANQIDHFVRGLIQNHEHVIRLSGTENARIHRWDQGIGNPDDYHSLKKSVTEIWRYPKEVYDWYHSAEVHTIKRRIPWKPVITIFGGVAAVAALGVFAYSSLFGSVDRAHAASEKASAAMNPSNAIASKAGPMRVDSFVPVMHGAPFSAPFYAPAVQVKEAPQISGCGSVVIDGKVDCFCTSQQGTLIEMSTRECLAHLKTGTFDWKREDDYYPKIDPYVPPLAEPAPVFQAQESPSSPGKPSSNEDVRS